MARKKKSLNEEERALWAKVVESADPLHRHSGPLSPPPAAQAKPKVRTPHKINPFDLGQAVRATTPSHDLQPGISERVASAPMRMDTKTFGKMKRGKLRPEGKLDLHGMTLASAHPRLTGFIQRAHADGKRLVLVVTGKGKTKRDEGPIPIRRGVLKHQVPQWLSMPPLGAIVLQVSEAHLSHGGGGAYYVYLRRTR